MLGSNYYTIYLILITLMSLYQCYKYYNVSYGVLENRPKERLVPSFFLMLSLAIFIGLRPDWSGFADSRNYIRTIESYRGNVFIFDSECENLLFDNLIQWFGCSGLSWTGFFILIASIYFGGQLIAVRKMLPRDTLFAYLIVLAAFSTFSYATNGIKAGAAASIFLVAIAYREKRVISALLLAISYGFHHSMQVLIVAFVIVSLIKNPKIYLLLWLFSFIVAALGITTFQYFFAGFTDEQGAGYLMADGLDAYITGFRLDFIIYSAMPVLLGSYLIYKKRIQHSGFNFIFNIYILANSVWMLCMYASFTNRIAYLSWQLLPIVLVYPFFSTQFSTLQYKQISYIALAHLSFTLFMNIIYY